MNKKSKLILISLIALISLFLFWQSIYWPKDFDSKEVLFKIEKGQGSKTISLNLEKQGLVQWSFSFQFYTFFKGISGKLKAGTYAVSSSMNILEIAERFVKGEVVERKLTIPEGFNLSQVEEELGMELPFKIREVKSLYSFLNGAPDQLSLEGFLFPDTYQLYFNEEPEAILKIMLDNFNNHLSDQLRNEIKRQKKTVFDVITMASLIEKEVKTMEDKKIVSGILWKRMNNKFPLQVDATVSYITGKKTTRVSGEETKIDSPYNTYKYLGLPLGPISNPGLESIEAAVYPKTSAYWYYLSTPEGKTIFSRTLDEHNIAKYKYLKNND